MCAKAHGSTPRNAKRVAHHSICYGQNSSTKLGWQARAKTRPVQPARPASRSHHVFRRAVAHLEPTTRTRISFIGVVLVSLPGSSAPGAAAPVQIQQRSAVAFLSIQITTALSPPRRTPVCRASSSGAYSEHPAVPRRSRNDRVTVAMVVTGRVMELSHPVKFTRSNLCVPSLNSPLHGSINQFDDPN